MKKSVSFIKFLLIALVSGTLVFGASKIIEPMKTDFGANSELSEVFPGGQDFNEISVEGNETINKIYEVNSSEKGYVFDATVSKGYSGPINFLIGITEDGVIKGFKVLSHSETQGFGAAIETPEFLEGLKDVNISNGVSAGIKDLDNGQIEAISGATITTNAFTDELKNVVNYLSTLSDKVAEITEEKPYYAEKYSELLPSEISNYTFEELKIEENDPKVLNDGLNRIIRVKDNNGNFNSYILQLTAKGYAGNIDTLVRVNDEYRVFDVLFASHNETPKLGAYIDDEIYKNSIRGLNLDKNFLTKAIKLRLNPVGEKDILLISGATVTSQAIQSALDNAIEGLVYFDSVKDNDDKFIQFNLDDVMLKSDESKSKYNHSELFATVDESKLLGKGSNEEVIYVSQALSNGEVIGKIFDVNVEGFAGTIEYGVLVGDDGVINDFVVYNHSETEGYGKVIEEESFKEKVLGYNLEQVELFVAGVNFDVISGATYTQDGLVKGLNSVIKAFEESKDANVVESGDSAQSEKDYTLFNGIDETKVIEGQANEIITNVVSAISSGEEKGKIFDAKVEGFAGEIEFGILISNEGIVEDFVVYSHSETEGYGAEIEESSYRAAIVGKKIEDIDSISGATITSDAMKKAYDSISEKNSSLGQ